MSSKPWRAEVVIFFLAAQFICFFAGMIAIWFLHHFHVSGFVEENDFGNVIIATLSFQGVTWVLIPVFLRLHSINWRDEFGLRGKMFRPIGLAVLALIVILPAVGWLEQFSELLLQKFGWQSPEEEAVTLIAGAKTLPMKVYLGFFAVVMAPVAEEFIFRGVLYRFVKQLGFPKLAWLGTSALFAAIHGSPAIFPSLFLLALTFAWLYEKTGNLLAPVFAHSLFNGVNLVILLFQDSIEDWMQKFSHHA
ncbi:MAG TPA: type II CAAX endopeptidase family protein [Verrucomicrobiae bacterium]|nr:type II CAAX endopeptidase family protein [Verrucomicrobiae bacterium]